MKTLAEIMDRATDPEIRKLLDDARRDGRMEAIVALDGRKEPALPIDDPLPCSLKDRTYTDDGAPVFGLLLGVWGDRALIANDRGGVQWVDLDEVRVHFAPSANQRLKLGWARKSPPGWPSRLSDDND